MKKNFFRSLMALMVCILTPVCFTSCGDNDDDSTPAGGTSVVDDGTIYAYWKGYIPAGYDTGLDWNGLAAQYDHHLFYMFDKDGNYQMVTAFYWPGNKDKIETAISNAKNMNDVFKVVEGEINVLYFKGTYTMNGDNIILTPMEWSEYNSWDHKWIMMQKSKKGLGQMSYTYKLANGKLTISTTESGLAHINAHHTLIGTLSRMANVGYPEVPEIDAIIGTWLKGDNEKLYINVGGSISHETKTTGLDDYINSRHYDTIIESKSGNYVRENDKLKVTWTYKYTSYRENGGQRHVVSEDIPEGERTEEVFDVTVGEETMTLWDSTWTRQDEGIDF